MRNSHFKKIFTFIFTASAYLLSNRELEARCGGKIDLAPAYLHIDILESGKTVHSMDMVAFKGDATILLKDGICIKPTILYGQNEGSVFTGGVGLGQCIPLFSNRLTLTPYAGCNFTSIRTHYHLKIPEANIDKHLRERFRSVSPYIALEASFNITNCFRIGGFVQYAWSRTHTFLEGFAQDRSHSEGPNYAVMMEYDITSKWSINAGAGYNLTLTKEKHGIRGAGGKIGIARWF